ncbi:MAG: YaiI/YqxD family protein [Chitinivibrionales bacterium]
MLDIYIDADACPVKQETYRVAARYNLSVTLVANCGMRTPNDHRIRLKVVGDALDAADDWIAQQVQPHDIVITADIPLASRCLEKKARVIGPTGKPFTDETIGQALAMRELMADLRGMGEFGGGPPPFDKRDRSQFLQKLDETIQAILREHG